MKRVPISEITNMNAMRILFVLLLFAPGCHQASVSPEDQKPYADSQREKEVDVLLKPMVDRLITEVGEKRVGITPFRKEGAEYEPRVSQYLVPRITQHLVEQKIAVFERRDLDEVVEELALQMSDLTEADTTVDVGHISGVDLLVIGTVRDVSLNVYRIRIKLLDLETARILMVDQVDIPRKLLPVKYGGN